MPRATLASRAAPGATRRRAAPTPGPTTRRAARQLADLANVGPATLRDFEVLGIRSIAQLARRDPLALYRALCRKTGQRHDPCVIDVFMATIAQARGGAPKPWWTFTARRKQLVRAP
ncbi:MAG: helix-hairpin-helix domain-containing protein [Phycisphaerae bacterium]|nr:helix-hairpin-helix domain-containing protein [Phycisphaerae bacterium]